MSEVLVIVIRIHRDAIMKVHFIINVHFLKLHVYFTLGSILLQSFYVCYVCFSITASQRFGRFAIPFRVTLLFSNLMVRVTAAETSSREGKHCPRMGSFNLWNKSKSGRLMSGLYGAWRNISHLYLRSKSVTTSPDAGVDCHAKWLAHPCKSQVGFVYFSAQFLQAVTIIRCCHTCSTWNFISHVDSSVIISKDNHLLDLWVRRNFLGRGEFGLLHSFDCDFNSSSKSVNHVSAIATIR
jgi:hypothetical protein